MFEAAEMGHKVDKAQYDKRIAELRVRLLNAQYDLRKRDFSVVLVLAGTDRPGRNEMLQGLQEVMDGRYIMTNALGRPTDEELEHPRLWRYWRRLPRSGQIGVFLGAWPLGVIVDRLDGKTDDAGFEREIEHVKRFEEALVADGTVLVKFWLHIPKRKLKKRLKEAKKDPQRVWWINERDRQFYKRYDEVMPIAERVVEETSTGAAPWQIVESTEARYRNLRVAEAALKALEERLERDGRAEGKVRPKGRRPVRKRARTILDTVDLNKKPLPHGKYRSQLDRHQAQLSRLTRKAHEKGVSSVLVFEGWDAAGKGGVIRRIAAAVNPEIYQVIPVAAPTEEEKAHHYLWRFWRREPREGEVTIFDRSWYGRVLVERVEGFASESEWQRAYSEINDFEAQLHGHGVLVLKFWLHIDRDEQLRRFRARQQTEYKKYKITDEDFRNREQWDHYACAVDDMVARTGTDYAPWHLVASNDKRRARVEVLRIYSKALKRRL